jgi:hypothetical protein
MVYLANSTRCQGRRTAMGCEYFHRCRNAGIVASQVPKCEDSLGHPSLAARLNP